MDPTDRHNILLPRLSLKEKFRVLSSRQRKPLRLLAAVLGGLVLLLAISASALYATVTSGLPDVTRLDHYDPAETSRIFASDGTLIATLFDQNRTYAKYDKIAPVMISALVAVEDRRFFQHQGIDLKGIMRAVLGNASSGGVEQGASTLTMQLARRLFLSNERTYSRKLREAVLAYRIDSQLSKEKILELYLNEVYFGSGAYGIDAAASVYFQKNPDKLALWQAALLAGLVQAPTRYSPLDNRKAALERLNQVLTAMQGEGKITAKQALEARKQAAAYKFVERSLSQADGMLKFPYFSTYVIRKLSEQFPDTYVRRGGLQVVTSLDLKLQAEAERALSQALQGPGRAAGADTGAVVVIDNATGRLLAMVGGPGWSAKRQFNAAWQARRQPGSSFKMFIYSAALEAGYTPENEFADTKATFSPGRPEEWTPSNSDGTFMGAIPMRTGLQFSRNLVSAKIIAHLGPRRVIDLAHRMGIDSDLPEYASLALGAGEVTPLQMTRAFSALPMGGVLRPAYAIKSVSTHDGELLEDFGKSPEQERVLSQDTATLMCEMLHRVVTGGTAQGANIAGTYVAGKTGTTDNFKDAWFIGFTPHHTVGVWIGRDDNQPMDRVFGGTIPADIFHRVATAAMAGKDPAAPLPGVSFGPPTTVRLCYDSTYLATPNCPRTYSETFRAGVVPTRQCPVHRQVQLPSFLASAGKAGASASGSGDPALSVRHSSQVVLAESSLPAGLNPRLDPEVVSPQGALIPYVEQAPSLRLVNFVIKGPKRPVRPPAQPAVKAPVETPAAPRTSGEDAGEMVLPEDNGDSTEPIPPLTERGTPPPTAEDDPALQANPAARTAPPAPAGPQPTAPLGVDRTYPRTGQDVSAAQDQMIYQPEARVPSESEPTVPADTVSPGP
jgi:penicillin-binding protein 1A